MIRAGDGPDTQFFVGVGKVNESVQVVCSVLLNIGDLVGVAVRESKSRSAIFEAADAESLGYGPSVVF